MAHKPFTLYKRPASKPNKHIYYVQFREPDTGERLSGLSTGQATKAAAETWAYEYLKKGFISAKANMSFSRYATDWWTWDRCPISRKRSREGLRFPGATLT